MLSPLMAQESDIKFGYSELLIKYQTLLTEHESALDDYYKLLTDYESLLDKYDVLKNDYVSLKTSFSDLSVEHESDIKIYNATKLSLEASIVTITNLEKSVTQLLSIADVRYFAMYPQLGYSGTSITGGIGLTMQIPKFPISVLFDIDYIGSTSPINLQIGIGIRF